MNSTQVDKYVIMTTPTSNIVNTAHSIHNNVRSATLPHVDCYSRLRASPRVFSELGYRPTRYRYAHQAVSLPQKGWVGLPAYRQYHGPTAANPLLQVCCCELGGQEILIDCCMAST